jgi:VWFA-related protein
MLNVSINQIYTNSCPRVRLLINVNDKDGYPLTGLLGSHLYLLENAAPRTIEAFYQLMEPISAALLLDYSGSMFDLNLIPSMETAAKIFIDRLNPTIGDEAMVIKYSSTYEKMTPTFTTDKNVLKTAIDSPFAGRQNTALYDTLWFAIDETAARTHKRAIVVISDGQDNASTHTLTEVVAKAKGNGIPVFTIGFGDVDAGVLPPLANETGGRYFFAPTGDDLNLIYLQIVDILVGQYALEYTSLPGSGSKTLDLQVNFNGWTGRATGSFTGCP